MKKKPNQNPNLIKNEFMWEEPKKKVKLYKNWKLYAIALPVIAIGAGTGSGIYYGVNGHPKKADLSTLHLNTQAITGVEGKNETDAFQAFLRHNENISDLQNKVEVGSFTSPLYTQNGNLTIKAKANSGCKGEVAVMIDALGQVSLDDLIKTDLEGIENMSQDQAFAAFLNNQTQNLADLKEMVILDFTKPSYTGGGSLVIAAKPDTKYVGSITLNIIKVARVTLNSLHLKQDLATSSTDETQAFNSFLELNSNVTDLRDNVEVTSFVPSNWETPGSLTIKAIDEGKYDGTITITIPKLVQIALSSLDQTAITGVEDMSENDAFNAFLKNNKAISDLRKNVVLEYSKPSYVTSGLLTITAKANTKYTGSIKVTINAIEQKSLDSLHLNTSLSTPVTNQQAAFDSFIELNSEVSDLRDNLEISNFTTPDYNQTGTLEVQAKANAKYTGTLTITISELIKTDIALLVTNTTIQGTASMTADEAFQALLTANSSWSNLSDYVDYDADSFAIPNSVTSGSLVVNAKPNTAFIGSLTVEIEKTIDLNTLNRDAVIGFENMTQDDVFNAFLANNQDKELTDLRANVTLDITTEPKYVTPGLLTITAKANTKYTGSIKITINAIGQKSLKSLGLNQELTTPYTDQEEAFNAFLDLNKNVSDLKDNVKIDAFNPSDYGIPGWFNIVANDEGKYKETIKVTIAAMEQVDLDDLKLNKIIQGTLDMTTDEAFAAFLANNQDKELADLKDNVTLVIERPTHETTGKLTIAAKPNTKYTGSIEIIISAIVPESLKELNLALELTTPYTDQEEAFNAFLELNSDVSDLKENVKIVDFSPSDEQKTGLLKIEGIDKYTDSVNVIFSKIPTPEIDQEIVNTIVEHSDTIKFDATMGVNQKLSDFFEGVIDNGEHQDDPHWYLNGQLRKYWDTYSILQKVDYDKFKFLGLYLSDGKPLTDEYISSTIKPVKGTSVALRVKFSYGTIQEQFVNFSLGFN